MTGDHVRTRQFYARRAKTANARCRVCDIAGGPKRRRLDSERLVVCGGGGDESDSKMLQLDDRDRISKLPQDLIHCILMRLQVHDAARTSVLSKEWKCIWAMNPQLVLDKLFFLRLTSNINKRDKHARWSAFSRAVEMIISVHSGHILSFNLYIPPKLDQCSVTRWIEHFLNKGIRYLELSSNYANHAYEIPSCLFDCVELINLTLHTWILNAPKECTSFSNLIHVKLINITFIADISFGTQVRYLTLEYCTGIKHLGCQFTNGNSLTTVVLIGREQIDWRWFECTSHLSFLLLELEPVSNFNLKKPINMIKYLSNLPSIHTFHTSGFALEVWRPVLATINGLATKVENLKELVLNRLGSYNLCQILNALYLIRCLPNLQRLGITLVDDRRFDPIALTSNLDSKEMSLGLLGLVKIQGVVGSDYVFYLVKLLLASSPSLEAMLLICSSKVTNPSEKLKMKQELQHFPRRSSSAKVAFR